MASTFSRWSANFGLLTVIWGKAILYKNKVIRKYLKKNLNKLGTRDMSKVHVKNGIAIGGRSKQIGKNKIYVVGCAIEQNSFTIPHGIDTYVENGIGIGDLSVQEGENEIYHKISEQSENNNSYNRENVGIGMNIPRNSSADINAVYYPQNPSVDMNTVHHTQISPINGNTIYYPQIPPVDVNTFYYSNIQPNMDGVRIINGGYVTDFVTGFNNNWNEKKDEQCLVN